MSGQQFAFGRFLLDAERRVLLRDGAPVAVGYRGVLLLDALLRRPGEVLTKAELLDAGWPDTTVEESNLSVQVALLRKALGQSPNGGEWIATIPRVGYRFLGRLDPVERADQGHSDIEEDLPLPDKPSIAVLGVGSAPAIAATASSHKPSVAVLPFTNMSSDPEQEYFSDGITEDIITELSRFRQLQVVARNSSFRFRGTNLDMIRVGHELGVAYLVEGSVRRIDPRIRISAQLIDAKSGHHLWAERFDRDQESIFSIPDQVVRTIVATLIGRLEAAVVEGAKRRPPVSLAAYECVLRAEALPFGEAKAETEARCLLEKAIALDPAYARAYATRGNLYRLEWSRDMSGSDRLLDQALEFTQKSVALDENDAVCHEELGCVLMHRHAHELAEHHFQKALSLTPNRPSILTSLGCLYAFLGRTDEALECFKTARALDPFEPSWYWRMLGIILFVARRPDEAIAAFKKSPTIPFWVHGYLAACYAHTDRIADARRHAAGALRLAPDFSIILAAAKDPFRRDGDRQHLIDGMRKAGLPE